ncbi:hypothetical protein [Alkalihalophilus marmarensis]|uniref:hypothetical protein n=1 Tax=Alkalihalophilus marmarensis TaxID=521377 RepID=UPI002DBFBFA5|nr:hypothetical protein [Alkalihalophilus marmarensis]MEC2072570.1 hypothetical protein [Alkalihalophilus marmarensis]
MNKRPYMHNEKKQDKASQVKNLINEEREGSSQKRELTPSAKLARTAIGLLALILTISGMAFSTGTMSDEAASDEIANRTSTEMESGFVLEDASQVALDSQDFAVGNFDGGTARMLIWDFTGDSEDRVQIMVDGQIIRESHTLTSNAAAYSVPVPSVVTIQGLEGQATYAVKFPERKYTIFNAVAPGGANAYTLTPSVVP